MATTAHPVNLDALAVLGVYIQYYIPGFNGSSMSTIATHPPYLSLLNRTITTIAVNVKNNTFNPANRTQVGLRAIGYLYGTAFGNHTSTSELPDIIARLDHRSRTNTALWCTLPPLLVIIVGLRFWSRKMVMGKIMPTDWMVLVATMMTLGIDFLFLVTSLHDSGKHAWDVPFPSLKLNFFAAGIAQLLYLPTIALVKFSLLLFYFELSDARWYRLSIYILAAFIASVSLGGFIANWVTCNPSRVWEHLVEPSFHGCTRQAGLMRFGLTYSALSDAAILLLPTIAVCKMTMDRRKRVGVIALLCLGGFGMFCAIALQVNLLTYLHNPDRTWHESPSAAWYMLEASIGIVCGSLPAVRVLFLKWYNGRGSRQNVRRSLWGFGPRVGDVDSSTDGYRNSKWWRDPGPKLSGAASTLGDEHNVGALSGPSMVREKGDLEAIAGLDLDVKSASFDLKAARTRSVGCPVDEDSGHATPLSEVKKKGG